MPLDWDQLFDTIPEALIALGWQGDVLFTNQPANRLFGVESGLGGRNLREFAASSNAASLAGVILHSLQDRRAAEIEMFNPPTGRWHLIRSYPAASGLTVFIQDVTDKRIAEDALRLSEAKFAGIVNISADAIISIDAEQRIIHFNSGAEEIFGWRASEMIGQPLDALIPERFRSGHPQHVRNFGASSIDARRMGERREIAGLRRSGEEFPAEASISKLNVGDQRVFTVVLRDVTERKRQEQTYRDLYEEAQRAVAARDDVLSFVSHDLGNPLAAIRIASAVLLKRIKETDPDWPHVAGIREAVEQAQRLIRDLLDVQKVGAGKLVLHPEQLDIDPLIDEQIHALRPLIDQKQLRIARESAGELPRVSADPDRVAQIVANILGNAVKFSPPEAVIRVRSWHDNHEVIVSVSDDGPGIPGDELEHVFDRYWQAHGSGKVGHGLGLAIVRALTRAHGGRTWAESPIGSGATFFFALPVV